jgi:hypothetical protein
MFYYWPTFITDYAMPRDVTAVTALACQQNRNPQRAFTRGPIRATQEALASQEDSDRAEAT